MDSIKVSVIIPTYKRDFPFLDRAVQSVLNQTYPNVEILVVDDNPPESEYRVNTESFMKKFAEMKNIIYIKNTRNLGGSRARNEGINQASGDFVTFLDDDDMYLPSKIERQVKFMIENNLEMSFTDLRIYNSEDKLVDFREYEIKSFDKEMLLKYHLTRQITGTPTFMYKLSSIQKIGGFTDAKIGQEFHLMLKTIENSLRIGYLACSDVIAYRHGGEGISMGRNKIEGEKEIYKFKKGYYSILSMKEKRFIRFRHYAVLAIAWKRNDNWLYFMSYSVLSLISSPKDIFKEFAGYLFRLKKQHQVGAEI